LNRYVRIDYILYPFDLKLSKKKVFVD